jgi:hypothetical protein
MKVINREQNEFGNDTYVMYTFDTGHQFRQWNSGSYFGYTPKGNYTSVPTTHKMIRLASEFEDRRMQVEA